MSSGIWSMSGGVWSMSGGVWCMSGGDWFMSGGVVFHCFSFSLIRERTCVALSALVSSLSAPLSTSFTHSYSTGLRCGSLTCAQGTLHQVNFWMSPARYPKEISYLGVGIIFLPFFLQLTGAGGREGGNVTGLRSLQ